jgi:hypothetical protein
MCPTYLVLGMMGKKRKANGCDYRRMRQESAETQLQLHELKGGNVVLERLLEEHKRSVEELTEQLRTTKVSLEEQKSNVQQLADEVSNKHLRVMQLETDNFFMAGDLQENLSATALGSHESFPYC